MSTGCTRISRHQSYAAPWANPKLNVRFSIQYFRMHWTIFFLCFSVAASHWIKSAQSSLKAKLAQRNIEAVAKNVIFFLGDGMSLPTVTAARIFKGQLEGSEFGEEGTLFFENFPNVGVSKVTCENFRCHYGL